MYADKALSTWPIVSAQKLAAIVYKLTKHVLDRLVFLKNYFIKIAITLLYKV